MCPTLLGQVSDLGHLVQYATKVLPENGKNVFIIIEIHTAGFVSTLVAPVQKKVSPVSISLQH
jgi:hypothetical protein